jgi:hypothetical protein
MLLCTFQLLRCSQKNDSNSGGERRGPEKTRRTRTCKQGSESGQQFGLQRFRRAERGREARSILRQVRRCFECSFVHLYNLGSEASPNNDHEKVVCTYFKHKLGRKKHMNEPNLFISCLRDHNRKSLCPLPCHRSAASFLLRLPARLRSISRSEDKEVQIVSIKDL